MISNVITALRIAVWLAQLLWVGVVLLMWWVAVPTSAAQQTTLAGQSCALLLTGMAVASSADKVLRAFEYACEHKERKR